MTIGQEDEIEGLLLAIELTDLYYFVPDYDKSVGEFCKDQNVKYNTESNLEKVCIEHNGSDRGRLQDSICKIMREYIN